MNSIVKFVFSIGLVCLMLPCSLWADTIYKYTGNPYTSCAGTYTCTGTTPALSLTFDTPLTGTQLDNLSDDPITVSTFSFTDETGLYITQANHVFDDIYVSTGPTGAITGWYIVGLATEPSPLTFFRINSWFNSPEANGVIGDDSIVGPNFPIIGDGEVLDNPGVWSSSSTAIPEPRSLLLVGGGLLGILVLAQRSKRGRGGRIRCETKGCMSSSRFVLRTLDAETVKHSLRVIGPLTGFACSWSAAVYASPITLTFSGMQLTVVYFKRMLSAIRRSQILTHFCCWCCR